MTATDEQTAEAKARLTAMGYAKLAEEHAQEAAAAMRAARAMTTRLAALGEPDGEPANVYTAIEAAGAPGDD